MFAISLVLVVLISAAILLYQYWAGSLIEREHDSPLTEPRPLPRDDHPAPARAA